MKTFLNYLRYSNLIILFRFNPISWNLIPAFRKSNNKEWDKPAFQFSIDWLFIKIAIYADDGSW